MSLLKPQNAIKPVLLDTKTHLQNSSLRETKVQTEKNTNREVGHNSELTKKRGKTKTIKMHGTIKRKHFLCFEFIFSFWFMLLHILNGQE